MHASSLALGVSQLLGATLECCHSSFSLTRWKVMLMCAVLLATWITFRVVAREAVNGVDRSIRVPDWWMFCLFGKWLFKRTSSYRFVKRFLEKTLSNVFGRLAMTCTNVQLCGKFAWDSPQRSRSANWVLVPPRKSRKNVRQFILCCQKVEQHVQKMLTILHITLPTENKSGGINFGKDYSMITN